MAGKGTLSSWLITDPTTNDLLGNCGAMMGRGAFWNLGYRLAPQAVGHGIVSTVAAYSVQRALAADPDRPVVASLLEHNVGSAKVAERAGLAKQCVSSMPIAS
nr:GNAT family N-acetyltransferase [Bowdeniella massiliensis]